MAFLASCPTLGKARIPGTVKHHFVFPKHFTGFAPPRQAIKIDSQMFHVQDRCRFFELLQITIRPRPARGRSK